MKAAEVSRHHARSNFGYLGTPLSEDTGNIPSLQGRSQVSRRYTFTSSCQLFPSFYWTIYYEPPTSQFWSTVRLAFLQPNVQDEIKEPRREPRERPPFVGVKHVGFWAERHEQTVVSMAVGTITDWPKVGWFHRLKLATGGWLPSGGRMPRPLNKYGRAEM